jgi:beta-N-acetylhexosaminidase
MERSDLGQLMLVGVPGPNLDSETAEVFRQIQPGGFVLFGRNIQTPSQLRKLLDDLRDLSTVEPILAIDQEGGRVSRLKMIGNEPPNAQQLRLKGDEQLIRTHGDLTGKLLRLFGFNLDLCPVLDVSFDDSADNSLRGRCFGTSVEQVIQFAGAFHDKLLSTGVLTCGKHFPGYAAAGLDPHHELPTIERSRADLERCELAIFRALAGRVSSMMVGHAWYPALDQEKCPASLSKRIVTDLLKQELGFTGLVMTDDLDMGAIVNQVGFSEAITRSITAGNHLAMICHRVSMMRDAYEAIRRLPVKVVDSALAAISEAKRHLAPASEFSEAAFRHLDDQVWDLRVAVLGLESAKLRSPDDGKRSPVEVY